MMRSKTALKIIEELNSNILLTYSELCGKQEYKFSPSMVEALGIVLEAARSQIENEGEIVYER